MSPKELMYIEDALNHAQFLETQCKTAASQTSDPQLKNELTKMAETHRRTFETFFTLM
ncbi:MAG: hypothetical protein IJU52_00235 [Clostridia bacterium]|nr:hypothetical protein [Clostridia bacterium]